MKPLLATQATLLVMLAALAGSYVEAHDGDHSHDAWYMGLMQPGSEHSMSPRSCCSLLDCKPTDYRINADGHYEAFIGPEQFGDVFHLNGSNIKFPGWSVVPDEVVIRDKEVLASNPTGRAVICWTPWRGILCFVPAAGW